MLMWTTQQVFSKLPIIAVCLLFTTSYANFCQINNVPHVATSEYETSPPKSTQQVGDDFKLLVWSTSSNDIHSHKPIFKIDLPFPEAPSQERSSQRITTYDKDWKTKPNCIENHDKRVTIKI